LDALFREIGIYSPKGQLYEPVDIKSLLYYHEAEDGQILEEGITEAGSMATFIAAGTSYSTHGRSMIPFYIYYSMFGFQRIEDLFYYLTLYNENYVMPPMPVGAEQGILKGLYKFKPGPGDHKLKAQLFGSGPIIREALRAQEILADKFGVSADVWSATSYKLLRNDALRARRWNMLHPTATPKKSYLEVLLQKEQRSEEHTSELQSPYDLVCRLL